MYRSSRLFRQNYSLLLGLLFFLLIPVSLSGWPLLVKTIGDKIVALDEKEDKEAFDIFFELYIKYTWPTSLITARELNQEDRKIFAPAIKEDDILRQKIKETDRLALYDVIFIPNVLTELFLLQLYLNKQEPLCTEINALWDNFFSPGRGGLSKFDNIVEDYMKGTEEAAGGKDFYAHCKTVNKACKSISLLLHVSCGSFLQRFHEIHTKETKEPTPTRQKLGTEFFYENRYALLADILEKFPEPKKVERKDPAENSKQTQIEHIKKELDDIKNNKYHGIIAQTLDLHYGARNTNRALLFRGTGELLIVDKVGKIKTSKPPTDQQVKLIDVSLIKMQAGLKGVLEVVDTALFSSLESIASAYQKKLFKPRSISLGIFLFGGFIKDPGAAGACAYNYFNKPEAIGYSLSINKQVYVNNYCNNLFYIAPLALETIASVFGEFFHARTKAVIQELPKTPIPINGFPPARKFIDTKEVLLITGDPLEHAARMSQFIADNASIIKVPAGKENEVGYKQDLRRDQDYIAKVFTAVSRSLQDSLLDEKARKIRAAEAARTEALAIDSVLSGREASSKEIAAQEEAFKLFSKKKKVVIPKRIPSLLEQSLANLKAQLQKLVQALV